MGPVDSKAVIGNVSLRTAGGETITVYAKSSTGDDGDSVRMWEDVVEPGLQAGMDVQVIHEKKTQPIVSFWLPGPHELAPSQSWPEGSTKDFPSYCGPPDTDFNSHTITDISIPGTSLAWKTRIGSYRDHSKWGVTERGSTQVSSLVNHTKRNGAWAVSFAPEKHDLHLRCRQYSVRETTTVRCTRISEAALHSASQATQPFKLQWRAS